jgi:hypothetical protein
MDTHRPPHFDGTNFPYYSARMACYLEVVDLGVWRVTRDGMKPPKNPEHIPIEPITLFTFPALVVDVT